MTIMTLKYKDVSVPDYTLTDYQHWSGLSIRKDYEAIQVDRQKGDFLHTTPYWRRHDRLSGACYIAGTVRCFSGGRMFDSWKGFLSSAVPLAGTAENFGLSQFIADSTSKAQFALNTKIVNQFPQWDLLTDLAEGKETLSMFRSIGSSIYGFTKSLLTRDFSSALSHLGVKPKTRRIRRVRDIWNYSGKAPIDKVADIWMLYRYGIMPSIYSFQNALKAFCEEVPESKPIKIQVTIPYEYSQVTKTPGSNPGKIANYNRISTRKFWGSTRMKAFVTYNDALKVRLTGLRLTDYLNTAWELVPYSFVVDWFIDVGGAIGQFLLPDLVGSVDVNVSRKHYTSWTESIGDIVPLDHPSIQYVVTYDRFDLSTIISNCYKFERFRGSTQAVLPPLGSGLSKIKRQLDSGCLIWQKTRRLL